MVPGNHGETSKRSAVVTGEVPFPERRHTARADLPRILAGNVNRIVFASYSSRSVQKTTNETTRKLIVRFCVPVYVRVCTLHTTSI